MTLYGYFEYAGQEEPTIDPGVDVPCPVCGRNLRPEPVKTISLFVEGDNRSYFYRVHRACFAELSAEQQRRLDDPIVDAVIQARSVN